MEKLKSPAAAIHISNLLTYISLIIVNGMTINLIQSGIPSASGLGVVFAILFFLDLFDGKFARLFNRSPELKAQGVQLDSFSDLLSFGIFPVIATSIFYQSSVTTILSAAFYLISAVTRLAFFNTQNRAEQFFIGIPTTFIGLLWSVVFLFPIEQTTVAWLFFIFGVLMISNIKVNRPNLKGLVLFLVINTCLIGVHLYRLFS